MSGGIGSGNIDLFAQATPTGCKAGELIRADTRQQEEDGIDPRHCRRHPAFQYKEDRKRRAGHPCQKENNGINRQRLTPKELRWVEIYPGERRPQQDGKQSKQIGFLNFDDWLVHRLYPSCNDDVMKLMYFTKIHIFYLYSFIKLNM